MDPHTTARLIALGRVGIGAALIAAPERVVAPWIGPDGERSGAKVLGAALGVRDVAIGVGQLAALHRGKGAAPWLRAGALADLVDLAATLRAREDLPLLGVVGTSVLAATGAATGTWLQSVLD